MKSESLGQRLARIRNERKLSQEALGEKSGVHRQVIARLETGARKGTTAATIAKLARALDVSASELIGDVSEHPTSEVVDEYLRSDWAKAAKPTDEEVAWLRSLPSLVLRGVEQTPLAIQALLLWRRNNSAKV